MQQRHSTTEAVVVEIVERVNRIDARTDDRIERLANRTIARLREVENSMLNRHEDIRDKIDTILKAQCP